MSQETIELHERAMAALNARELSDELAAETLAPSFRVENAATAVTDKTYCGVEGLREWVTDMFVEAPLRLRVERRFLRPTALRASARPSL